MVEHWKPLPGMEEYYEISDAGRVASISKGGMRKILRYGNRVKNNSYTTVKLKKEGKTLSTRVHRLVALAFIPNPEGKKEVNHISCNKRDNRVSNLEWVDPSENIRHAIHMRPNMLRGMIEYNTLIKPKIIIQKTLEGLVLAKFSSAKEAQRQTNVCSRNILQVASMTEYKPGMIRKQAGGFIWEYET